MEITTTQLLVTTGIGVIIGFLITKIYYLTASNTKKDHANQLDRDYIELKTKATFQLDAAQKVIAEKEAELGSLKTEIRTRLAELKGANEELFTTKTSRLSIKQAYETKLQEYTELKDEFLRTGEMLDQTRQKLATANAHNSALYEKLENQKQEMARLGEKFNLEFQHIATGILDANASKFAEQNKASLAQILEPLGQNIDAFKSKVHEVYLDETKERSYLKNEIKNLVELNKIMSDETRNLTKALKGESKTQGRWGEMILESILERSGLVKNREYFMEHE